MSVIHDGPPVFVNADKTAIVDGSSPDAAFLLVGTGSRVPGELLSLYREHFDAPTDDDEQDTQPHTVVYGSTPDDQQESEVVEPEPEQAETPKPRKRAAKRKAAAKSDD